MRGKYRADRARPRILLLDEPTNHLDLGGIEWLEGLLRQAAFASVIVSSGPVATQTAPRAPAPKREVTASAAMTTNTPVSSGYVAVLSSKKSRMDAMKAYASLDQKYRDMLASSTFDVQEADLGDKGVWYRAVIGPPRSYEGAKKLCDDLKAAGHQDCWPARY